MVIGLGWLLARSGFLSSGALHDLNRLTYWVGLPCLLFYRIAEARHELSAVAGLLTVTVLATLLAAVGAGLAGWLLRLPGPAWGTFVQGVTRGNLVFVGLPVILYAFAAPGADGGSAEASALLVFGPLVVLYNVLAVVVLLASTGAGRGGALRHAGRGLITNPILLACLGGLLFSVAQIELPTITQRSLAALGQMALPLALICIGGTLYNARLQGSVGLAVAAVALKLVMVPLIGWLLLQWIELPAQHAKIALILLACPTASATYVLVRQLRGDEALASSIVVIGHLLAAPALIAVLSLSG